MLFSPGDDATLLSYIPSKTVEFAAVVAPVVEDTLVYTAVA